jgi:glycogenin glucosyltransferase
MQEPEVWNARGADGAWRAAFVTLLMLNDGYLPGALMLAHALRRQQVQADLVCLVTPEISSPARLALELLFDRVVEVEKVYVPHQRAHKRPYIPYVFTKLQALRMGADGDLGLRYEKLVFLDADVLPLKNYHRLLALAPPAGVINERKSHLCAWDAAGRYLRPAMVERTGKWGWHQVYEKTCPHGRLIPRAITDRVSADPANMGINGSALVLAPSAGELAAIRADLLRPEVRRLAGELFDWPEMQYLTMRWSGRWRNVDLRYSGFKGYPCLSVLYGTHFAGFKPWRFSRARAMRCYGRYEDFRYWFSEYLAMVAEWYPRLQQVASLRRLLGQVRSFQKAAAEHGPKRSHAG